VHVASADAARAHADEHLVVAECGNRHLGDRELTGFAEQERFQRTFPFVFSLTRIT
jgi:hypothetical protein